MKGMKGHSTVVRAKALEFALVCALDSGIYYVALSKLLNLSVPPFPHLKNKDADNGFQH